MRIFLLCILTAPLFAQTTALDIIRQTLLRGVTRAIDGTWDRGAYEYNSGAVSVKTRSPGGARFPGGVRK